MMLQRVSALLLGLIMSFVMLPLASASPELALRLARSHQFDKASNLDMIARWTLVPEECRGHSRTLNTLLTKYHTAAIRSTNPKSQWAAEAKTIYDNITSTLLSIEKNSPTCFDPVARAYAVAAVAMLESSYDQTLLKLAAYLAYNLPQWNLNTPNPRLSILSPNRRKENCGWETPGISYTYSFYGGFFCNAVSIKVDPFLPPLNLGASFVHEIDHMFRDRFGRLPVSWDEVRELAVYDETLSSALAAFFQLRMSQAPRDFVRNRSWLWTHETTLQDLKEIPGKMAFSFRLITISI